MTKKQLVEQLNEAFDDDDVVVCMDTQGMWDNIEVVEHKEGMNAVVWGGGSPFSSDR